MFLLIELKERQPIKFWLYISIRVIKVIEKNGFNIKTNIYDRIRKYLSNYAKKFFRVRLSEYC